MTYLLLGFLVTVAITFYFGLGDDAYLRLYHEGVWYRDIFNSMKYYVLNVLPYWWLMIIIGSIVLGSLFWGVKIGVEKIMN